jgi:hypothetical protein
VDAVFAAAGNGTSVGLNVGSGKTLTVAGTLTVTGASSTINATSIGATTADTGAFTTLSATGNVTLGDADTDTITQAASYVTGTQLKSAKTATNTLSLAAYDVDGTAYTNLVTLTASNTPTLALTSTGVGTINNMSVGATTASTGAFTTLSATGAVTFNTTSNAQSYTTTGAGTITISSGTAGTINNMSIGATTPLAGTFTTLSSTGNTTIGDADTDTITQAASYVTGTQLKSAKTATNTLNLAAYDTDGLAYTNLITLTASTTPTLALTSTGVGTINNMSVGATTASTGAFTTLSATGVTTVQAGTVSLPAITTTGDTNTGIFFPAADTIAFSEGGVESMRIDSSGRVLVGTTSAATPSTTGFISVANTFGFKNRLINSAMVIDQRNAGASVTPTADPTYTIDRWAVGLSQASKFSVQQSSTAPAGFSNSLKFTSLAATSLGAGDYFTFQQSIEGFNTADLAWGTASASTITLSFRVYSSLTGTFGGSLINGAVNRSYPFTYTISSANTWTTISITVAGDTSGTWATNNTTGIIVMFGLGVGTSGSGTAGAWAGALYRSATGATSVVGTNGATFFITGVQLEKGSTATSFDYRPYGTELALCQRYYESGSCDSGYGVSSSQDLYASRVCFAVVKRASPTMTVSFSYNGVVTGASTSSSSVTTQGFTPSKASVGVTNGGGVIFSSSWISSIEL